MAVSELFKAVLRAWRRLHWARIAAESPPTEQERADALESMAAPVKRRRDSEGSPPSIPSDRSDV